MSLTPPNRRVITFYSFKGGVGRTMTLANVAYRLANKHGLRVIAVDWDLEAPGLHRFFGIDSTQAAKGHGVLDYFDAWEEAMERRDPQPPQVSDWLVPITDEKHAPRFGSLSLLLAGKLDESYDKRLAELNWQGFYEHGAGASAVETLREQLVGLADVVLIDSRTGLTDAGGICTIQVPDGVVLMTAPNQQSLEGTGRVARSIAKAPAESRAGRDRARMWLVTSRVPMVEETYLAERWFEENKPWFEAGKEEGLWLKEDHPEGFQSHKIPHRGRWGFDETVLSDAAKVDPSDLLVTPYEHLAETLLRWLRGEPPIALEVYKKSSTKSADWGSIQELEAEIANAEHRGDILGMAASMLGLATRLGAIGRHNEAIRKSEQASGIFLSRGLRVNYLTSLYALGWSLNSTGRYTEAAQMSKKALGIARELGDVSLEVEFLRLFAESRCGEGAPEEAIKLVTEAYRIARTIGVSEISVASFWLLGDVFVKLGELQKATEVIRESMRLARSRGDSNAEERSLGALIHLSDAGEDLPDADALRTRLAELKAAPPIGTSAPAAATAAKPVPHRAAPRKRVSHAKTAKIAKT